MKSALMVVLVLAAVACGGKVKPDSSSQPADPSGGQQHAAQAGHAGEKSEMSAMPPQIVKFHDILAPRWHAERGPQRTADTCAVIAQFQADADAIVAAPVPEGASPEAWSAGGKQLVEAVVALGETCKANDAAAFEPAFERLHTSFHHVMEAASAQPGGHAEHH